MPREAVKTSEASIRKVHGKARSAPRGDKGTAQIIEYWSSSRGSYLGKGATPLPLQKTVSHTQADDLVNTENLQIARVKTRSHTRHLVLHAGWALTCRQIRGPMTCTALHKESHRTRTMNYTTAV
jgi:hypothetical protein